MHPKHFANAFQAFPFMPQYECSQPPTDILVFCLRGFLVLDARRIEDTGKLGENIIRSANAAHLTLIQKSDTLTATNFIKIRR